ncbi:MAG: N-acetyltransferase [Salaquimonas sp.]
MKADITLFGETRCHKTRFYQNTLKELGVAYDLAEVDKDTDAAKALTELTGSASKFPTFLIKGKKVRNPTIANLEKELARAGIFDPGLVHDEKSQRFVRYMRPADAFASYSWQGELMVVGHIEISMHLRGSGLGTRFATELLEQLEQADHDVRLTCPFLRKVAQPRRAWHDKFNLKG